MEGARKFRTLKNLGLGLVSITCCRTLHPGRPALAMRHTLPQWYYTLGNTCHCGPPSPANASSRSPSQDFVKSDEENDTTFNPHSDRRLSQLTNARTWAKTAESFPESCKGEINPNFTILTSKFKGNTTYNSGNLPKEGFG
ncbi:hypothetical protein C1H46_015455 [Malus baccata]|uniref:Uncharacterized protein n=1 Tax=Malus baccata TaxID=106549 RepID=A0A540MKT9_MALBA|nr:hypothetical protein C1H46_015455 [Malus baccata]